jgi:hypothetical protein
MPAIADISFVPSLSIFACNDRFREDVGEVLRILDGEQRDSIKAPPTALDAVTSHDASKRGGSAAAKSKNKRGPASARSCRQPQDGTSQQHWWAGDEGLKLQLKRTLTWWLQEGLDQPLEGVQRKR